MVHLMGVYSGGRGGLDTWSLGLNGTIGADVKGLNPAKRFGLMSLGPVKNCERRQQDPFTFKRLF